MTTISDIPSSGTVDLGRSIGRRGGTIVIIVIAIRFGQTDVRVLV